MEQMIRAKCIKTFAIEGLGHFQKGKEYILKDSIIESHPENFSPMNKYIMGIDFGSETGGREWLQR